VGILVGRGVGHGGLDLAWQRVPAGTPVVALVSRAGIGKTTPVGTVPRRFGRPVSEASGDEFESRLPYGGLERLFHRLETAAQ
jgi:hypothetical protein